MSGHKGKLQEEDRRKILTVFAYGTDLGPTQIAKNIADVSARQVSFVNQCQVTTEKLEAAITSTILRKLGTASRKNKLYFAFSELGRVVRTIFLLEYISDDALRQVIQAAQNKCEGFNNFAQWAYFGSDTIEENVREDQLKIIKYNHLIANLMIFHNCHTMTQTFKELEAEGMKLTPELAAAFSPYRTHHANRFGMYELRERDLEPIDYGVTFQM